jgi:hypothetical protein
MVIGGVILMITTRLNTINDAEIQKNGLNALKDALGVAGTIKFLEQYDNGGSGDYTEEKYKDDSKDPTDAEIRKMFGCL